MSTTNNTTQMTVEEKYENAVKAYKSILKSEEFIPLRDIFKELGDYKDAAKYLNKCEIYLAHEVGKKVTFGNYKGKDIVWRVLQREGYHCMLLAEEVVDHRCFNMVRDHTTWSTSALRRWLNKQFLEEAFTLQERMSIILSSHQNNTDPRWDNDNGPDTRDKAFVFSLKELDEYLPNIEDRSIGEWWWLRGHGYSNLSKQVVYRDGTIYKHGLSTTQNIGVRPAMWIRLRI